VRRRFNVAVLEAVYIRDRKIGRTEFSEVFAPLFSRPSSNRGVESGPEGIRTPDLLAASQTGLNAVLTRENAGQKRAEQPKLFAERTTHVGSGGGTP
jgi:hypothetical protein